MSQTRYQIPNLLGGVSQQQETSQAPNQCARQDDFHVSATDGLTRRPGTEHRFTVENPDLAGGYLNDAHVQWLLGADLANSYALVITHGSADPADDVRVFRLSDGVEQTVALGNEGSAAREYLRTAAQNGRLRGVTLGDSTIMVDRGVAPAMTADLSDVHDFGSGFTATRSSRRAFWWVRSGSYLRTYGLYWRLTEVDGTETTYGPALIHTHDGTFGDNKNGIPDHNPRYEPLASAGFYAGYQISTIKPAEICECIYSHPEVAGSIASDQHDGGIDKQVNDDLGEVFIDNDANIYTAFGFEPIPGVSPNVAEEDAPPRGGSVGCLQFANTDPTNATLFRARCDLILHSDNTGDLVVFGDHIQSQADLPTFCVHNHVVKVDGDPDNDYGDYYLKFVANDKTEVEPGSEEPVQNGEWTEGRAGNEKYKLDPATMPVEIVRSAGPGAGEHTFTIQEPTWADRIVGDDNTNPQPAFVGEEIQDVFFHRGRLGFLLADQVVLSGVDDFFNFWKTTQLQTIDSDPINVLAAHARSSPLHSVAEIQGGLVLFGTTSQFLLQGEPLLSPTTASVQLITNFPAINSRPVSTQSSVMFGAKSGNAAFSRVLELSLTGGTDLQYEANDRTLHVPTYIPGNVAEMASSEAEALLAVRVGDEPNKANLYMYRWFDTPDGRALNSWFRFRIGPGERIAPATSAWSAIQGMVFVESALWIAISRVVNPPFDYSQLSFERISFDSENDSFPATPGDVTASASSARLTGHYRTHLDRRVPDGDLVSGYDSGTGRLWFDLPYLVALGSTGFSQVSVVSRIGTALLDPDNVIPPGRVYRVDEVEQFNIPAQSFSRVWISDPDGAIFALLNPALGAGYKTLYLWIGENYGSEYEFAQLSMVGTDSQGIQRRVTQGRTQLLRMKLAYEETSSLTATVRPRKNAAGTAIIDRRTYRTGVYPFEPGVLGSELNSPNIRNGVLVVGIMSRPEWVTVELSTDSPFPASVESAELEVNYEARGAARRA